MMVDAEDLTIHKTVHVSVPVERAFEVFTVGWLDWWPMATHSIGNGEGSADWRVGGTVSELVDGKRHDWADILEYDPPNGLTMRWRVSADKPATELRLRFVPDGDGTRVELTHSGWESYPDGGGGESTGYSSGWETVLGHYTAHVDG
jgi:uncharacterized protein YndB with AHSA1/START domain